MTNEQVCQRAACQAGIGSYLQAHPKVVKSSPIPYPATTSFPQLIKAPACYWNAQNAYLNTDRYSMVYFLTE
jgi:hypothetical protein